MSRRGFSLAEVLVAAGLLSLISLALTQIFFTSAKVVEQGAARTHLQQLCRETLNRTAPCIVGAADPDDAHEGLYFPEIGDAPAPQLWFYSPDDLFGNAVYDPRSPTFYFYRLIFSGGTLRLEKLQMNGTPMAVPPPRVLARDLYDLDFERPEQGMVRITVAAKSQIQGATHVQRDIESHLRTTVSVPYYTTR